MELWCDGGLKEICVTNSKGIVTIVKTEGTNNENEYKAMILALEKANDGDIIYADSQLIVNQITKGWKVKAQNLYKLNLEAIRLYKSKNVKIEWVSRDWNKAGWILEGNTSSYKKEKFEFLH